MTRYMMVVAIGRVRPMAGRKTAGKRAISPPGALTSSVTIAAIAVIVGCLKMELSAIEAMCVVGSFGGG